MNEAINGINLLSMLSGAGEAVAAARGGIVGLKALLGLVRSKAFSEGVGAAAEAGDSALVVRGGTNTADRFSGGSGVTLDEAGNVHGVSVNSAPGRSLEDLTQGIRNKQVGVTTVGDIRAAGGYVRLDPTPGNPFHCLIGGCSPEQFSNLFTPTTKNPWLG